ncbi:hypothetical protein ACWEQA_18730 [Nocardia sp. NPDC004085]
MGRLTDQARTQKEAQIRAAMDRLLRGEIPPGGKCDVKPSQPPPTAIRRNRSEGPSAAHRTR